MSTNVAITVIVRDEPPQRPVWARVVATVIVAGFVLWVLGLIWWLVGAVALYATARVVSLWYRRAQAAEQLEEQRCAEIAARADRQHAWVLAGDPRGTYGTYGPGGNRTPAAARLTDCSRRSARHLDRSPTVAGRTT